MSADDKRLRLFADLVAFCTVVGCVTYLCATEHWFCGFVLLVSARIQSEPA